MQSNWRALVAAATLSAAVMAPLQGQGKPQVTIPNPGVPEIMTIEGKFVRAAYNNEGYAIIGYQVANRSIDEEWMMIDLGITVRDGVPEYTLTRDKLWVDTHDGNKVALASIEDHRTANLRAIEARARVQRDSIDYFPPMASQACRIGFFADPTSPARAWNEVAISNRRACMGRLFFRIPGGIKHGQYFLNVQFEKSLIRVPFRILTEEEERLLGDNYGDIRKQVQEAFRPKKQ